MLGEVATVAGLAFIGTAWAGFVIGFVVNPIISVLRDLDKREQEIRAKYKEKQEDIQ